MSTGAAKQNIIDRPLSKGRAEVLILHIFAHIPLVSNVLFICRSA
jgi:hypothetical protein